jgi:hypothetical protein
MTGLIDNVEQILPIVSTISIVSGILAIGLLVVTVMLWLTQPIKLLPAVPKKNPVREEKSQAENSVIMVLRNYNTKPVQKFNNIVSLGYMPTSGWIGTNHTEEQEKENIYATADEQC